MATKNLARTVIEGGRARYSKDYRRWTHAAERAMTRMTLDRIARDPDQGDDITFAPRPVASAGFRDRLNPAYRWLRAQVGRPWDKVRAEIFARFDTRTTAGRHLVFDHLLGEVLTHARPERHCTYELFVGRGGILHRWDPPRRF